MSTIGQLAKEFNLSRSTLLYYDSIGLLSPTARTESRYRVYTEEDQKRLQQICHYRQLGLPLKEIKKILLNSSKNQVLDILEQQLIRLGEKIRTLKEQQFSIVKLLKNEQILKHSGVMNKNDWIKILRSTGLSDEDMDKWHIEFEKIAPKAHHDFLLSLGISKVEIEKIRKKAKKQLYSQSY